MSERIVVITGASAGIGAAAAERLAAQGHRVVLAARRKDALAAVASRCHGRADVIVADVTVRDQVTRLADETLARHGRVDVWINNAGQGLSRMPSQLTDQDVDAMMQVNVKSVLYGMQAVLPHFKSRNEGQVINISSMLGRVPFAAIRSAYSGAKHFMNALTAMFREEVQQTHPGIQFTIVSPGVVATDFGLNAIHGGPDSRELRGAQTPEEVAAVIARVVETRQPDIYTRPGAQEMIAKYYATLGVDPDVPR
jgi:NADP-dependent 3-hydroxy acid dehydrogenase YdfG